MSLMKRRMIKINNNIINSNWRYQEYSWPQRPVGLLFWGLSGVVRAEADLLVSHVLPGGSSPRPPFSRFARRAVTDYSSITALTEHPGPNDLLVAHRTSWGILPQTPVFSLRSARCNWYSSITALTEHPGPKDLFVGHRTSWGILPQTPVFSLRSARCYWSSSITLD
jgi:hypothetical protein